MHDRGRRTLSSLAQRDDRFERPVAQRLVELSRDRWQRSGVDALKPVGALEKDCWPERLPVDFEDVDVAISRTIPDMEVPAARHENEQLCEDLIDSVKHFIHAESQYFASHKSAVAIAWRLAESDRPEIVTVNPLSAEGVMESIAIESARARLVQALRDTDHHGRFCALLSADGGW